MLNLIITSLIMVRFKKKWWGLVILRLPNLKSRLGKVKAEGGGEGVRRGKGKRIVVFSYNFPYNIVVFSSDSLPLLPPQPP